MVVRLLEFTGPVVVVAGEYDVPFCGGNCNQAYQGYTSLPAASQRLFPNATAFRSVVGLCRQSVCLMSDLADLVSSTEDRAWTESTIHPSGYVRAGERFLCGVWPGTMRRNVKRYSAARIMGVGSCAGNVEIDAKASNLHAMRTDDIHL